MTSERIRELADEAARCIVVNDLRHEEDLYAYLHPFLKEIIDEATKPKPKKLGVKRKR